MRICQNIVMVIGQEKKPYYWAMTSCSECGQVEVVEWFWLVLVMHPFCRNDTSPFPGSLIVKLKHFRESCGGRHNLG